MNVRNIFVGGVDRSGTTLLARLLTDSGFGVSGPETIFKEKWVRGRNSKKDVESINTNWRYRKIWQLDYNFNNEITLQENIRFLFQKINDLPSDNFVMIDHTPHNIRLKDELERHFDNSAFIHIVRDPRTIFRSMKPLDWGPNTAARSALYWRKNIMMAQVNIKLSQTNSVTIKYEDLIHAPEDTIKNLAIELRLKKRNYKRSIFFLPNYTSAQHSKVSSKLDKSRTLVSKDLSFNDTKIIEKLTGSLMDQYGYSRLHDRKAVFSRRFQVYSAWLIFKSLLIELARFPLNKYKNFQRRQL